MTWEFRNKDGDFLLNNPEKNSYMYFPLANERGMMAAITPTLGGDIKTGQNTFVMLPVSSEDLHNSKTSRNFWVYIDGKGPWSATGASAMQEAHLFDDLKDDTKLEAGILWHKVTRQSKNLGIQAEITTFVPVEEELVELTKVVLTNKSEEIMVLTPTVAIPLYARSADNLRDHRHVTSLLNRIYTTSMGVIVKPTLTFDERGHKINEISYGVLGSDGEGKLSTGYFPTIEGFIGEGGSLGAPEVIYTNQSPLIKEGASIEAHEAMGGIQFEKYSLKPGESKTYIVVVSVDNEGSLHESIGRKYLSEKAFDCYLEKTKDYWNKKLNLSFETGDTKFDNWMKWVSFQPILRRIYGCSFLPHHDYGRGGRGWRDLWQDCLALLVMEPERVKGMLLDNYGGIRVDGTNATIIGQGQGEFIADRNNITRVWMDHGAWPFLTTKLYIEQSGDLDFLLQEQSYFKDAQVCRGMEKDWDYGQLKDKGTILEHLLIQHLTAFYDVGEHNTLRLNGADWNDGLDMAREKGESVAFTALYCSNLRELIGYLEKLEEVKKIETLTLAKEIMALVEGADYNVVQLKRQCLEDYCKAVKKGLSGEKISLSIKVLKENLKEKVTWMTEWLREKEWISNKEGFEWFNGYYDNEGNQVEGDYPEGVRMMLTSQVFQIMGGIATDNQIKKIIEAADHYLYDKEIGGYRLNTCFNEVKLDLGRLFGFGFGHKENGAVFSHMAIMYGNALYQRGYVKEGYKVLDTLYKHCLDFKVSRIYPGIPEYINAEGRGMYHYLTGSASWLILTVLTEMFGIKGELGDLVIEPKLVKEQFSDDGFAKVETIFAGKVLEVTYHNPMGLEYGEYRVEKVMVEQHCDMEINEKSVCVPRSFITEQEKEKEKVRIEIILG